MSHIRAPIRLIATARSGDKGSHANIGIIASNRQAYEFLLLELTEDKLCSLFSEFTPSSVVRYLLPNLMGINFVLKDILKGGAAACLRVDSQGKTFGEALLNMELMIPEEVLIRGDGA